MGDASSAFLGYTFAVLPVSAAQHNPRLAVAGVLLVWPFVCDAAFTIAYSDYIWNYCGAIDRLDQGGYNGSAGVVR